MDPKTVTKRFAEPSEVSKNTPSLQRDEWLEGFAVGIRDNRYVLDELIPEKQVKKDSAKYRVYSPKGRFKAAARRAETALPEQSALEYSEDTYTAEEYAMSGWVSDDSLTNAHQAIDPLADEVEYLSTKIMLTQEILISNEYMSAIKAGGTDYYTLLTATTKWYGGTNIDILGNISTAIKAVAKATGNRPNITNMNTDTFEVVIHDTDVVDVLKRASIATVTEAIPIQQLRGMRIAIADAIVNAGTRETASYKNILYDVDTVTAFKQCVFISFVKANDKLTLGTNFVPKPFKVLRGRGTEGELRQATVVAVYKKLAPKVTNVGAGYVIANVLGS
jgi:hypothetical protein